MPRSLLKIFIAAALVWISSASYSHAYVPYDSRVFFLETVLKDITKLMPRAMGRYIYENRYDFMRGMTFMSREVEFSVYKGQDLEEIRNRAYERLMRDIPYCVDAFKGGELKMDTAPANLAGRLGMIGYSLVLLNYPSFPDLRYLRSFNRTFEEAVNENVIDISVFYDGYGDFKCIGELMERFKKHPMPEFVHQRNPIYPSRMKEDIFPMFRPPDQFHRYMILTNVDLNRIYESIINDILDAYVFIWKCSGMDLQHPSYSAPPATMIVREKRNTASYSSGVLNKPSVEPDAFRPPPPPPQQQGSFIGVGPGVGVRGGG